MNTPRTRLTHIGAVVAGFVAGILLFLPALQGLFVFRGLHGSDWLLLLLILPAALSPVPLSILGISRPGWAGTGMLVALSLELTAGFYAAAFVPGGVEHPLSAGVGVAVILLPQLFSGVLFLLTQRYRENMNLGHTGIGRK